MDGNDKPRPFGFATFEDAESTYRAYRMLQELEIPAVQSNKRPTKLTVLRTYNDRLTYLGSD